MAKKGKVDRITETTTGADTEFAASGIEGKKALLAELEAEHEEVEAGIEARGVMDGTILSARRARVQRIEDLKAEIESVGAPLAAPAEGEANEGA